jgi:hypothetical protein
MTRFPSPLQSLGDRVGRQLQGAFGQLVLVNIQLERIQRGDPMPCRAESFGRYRNVPVAHCVSQHVGREPLFFKVGYHRLRSSLWGHGSFRKFKVTAGEQRAPKRRHLI